MSQSRNKHPTSKTKIQFLTTKNIPSMSKINLCLWSGRCDITKSAVNNEEKKNHMNNVLRDFGLEFGEYFQLLHDVCECTKQIL